MQHPPTDKALKKRSAADPNAKFRGLDKTQRYNAAKDTIFDDLRSRFGTDFFAPFPLVNPHKVIEKSKTEPMFAACMLRFACTSIAKMEERSVREYVAAAYSVACDMRSDEAAIRGLAREVEDGRYKNGVPIEVVNEDILHYLFIFVFFQSGIRTRDRATQYAQGLKEYFYEGRPPEVVGEIIVNHGPDRLRRVAQRKAKLIEGAQEWAKQSKDPAAPPFDEVLATVVAEETKAATTDVTDESFDHGSRDLPPDGSDDEDPGVLDDDDQGAVDEQHVLPTGAGEPQAADVPADETTANSEEVGPDEGGNGTDEASSIDGNVIDERLQQILFETMSLGASLMTQPLDPEVKKDVVKMTVMLSNDLLDLRRMIKGV